MHSCVPLLFTVFRYTTYNETLVWDNTGQGALVKMDSLAPFCLNPRYQMVDLSYIFLIVCLA